jgi:hypothetical protein
MSSQDNFWIAYDWKGIRVRKVVCRMSSTAWANGIVEAERQISLNSAAINSSRPWPNWADATAVIRQTEMDILDLIVIAPSFHLHVMPGFFRGLIMQPGYLAHGSLMHCRTCIAISKRTI